MIDILLWAFFIVFVVLPVGSAVMEKYFVMIKGQDIKDALDISNIAVYNSLDVPQSSSSTLDFKSSEALEIFRDLLKDNLKLKDDLVPKADSIADGPVTIDELILYSDGFPLTCPGGKTITRTTIHAQVTVPIKPMLYRAVILGLMGREYVELKVHVDTVLPVNN